MEVDESAPTTVQAGIFRKSKDTEPPSRFLQERLVEAWHMPPKYLYGNTILYICQWPIIDKYTETFKCLYK